MEHQQMQDILEKQKAFFNQYLALTRFKPRTNIYSPE